MFRLWIHGEDLVAQRASVAARRLVQWLERPLGDLEIVRVDQEPERARLAGVLLTPTLERDDPGHHTRVCVDLEDIERVASLLGQETPIHAARRETEVSEQVLQQGAHGIHPRLWIGSDGRILAANAHARRVLSRSNRPLSGQHFGVPLVARDVADAHLLDGTTVRVRSWDDGESDGSLHLIELNTREDELRIARELESLRGRVALQEAQILRLRERAIDQAPVVEDFSLVMSTAQARARRNDTRLTAIFVVLDGLLPLAENGSEGMTAEDVIALVWGRIRETLRPGDRIARASSHEILVLPEDCQPAGGREIAERLARALADLEPSLDIPAPGLSPRLAVGQLPEWIQAPEEVQDLFASALKRARSEAVTRIVDATGGGPIENFQARLAAILAEEEQLTVVGRPLVRLVDRKVIGHGIGILGPEGPLHDPKVLFGLALDSGRTIELDLLALRIGAEVAHTRPEGEHVLLRLSPITLSAAPREEILSRLEPLLATRAVSLAISGRGMPGCPPELISAARDLQEAGVRLVLDDVTPAKDAYEALILLKPQAVRLDPAVARGIAGDLGRRRRLERLRLACASLDIHLVADGVDRADDLLAISELGLHAAQGERMGEGTWQAGLERDPREVHVHHPLSQQAEE